MVVQKTLDSLREKPHDEKKAVAGGIAIAVVVLLLIGWGFLFLRKIQRGTIPTLEGALVPADQYDSNILKETQQQIQQIYRNSSDQLQEIRENAAQHQGVGGIPQSGTVPVNGTQNEFGAE